MTTSLAVTTIGIATDHTGHTDRFRIQLSYNPADPYAVTIDFGRGDDNVWQFHRDLLIDGFATFTGLGDVQVWPYAGSLAVLLKGHGDHSHYRLLLSLHLAEVRWFAERMLRLVPRGDERVDVDAWLAGLLRDGAR